jgi:hypothetical protein
MAVRKVILKNTNLETVVKVAGTSGNVTLTLDTDLLASTQVKVGSVQTVNIAGVRWHGLAGSSITVTRNSVNVLTLPGDSPNSDAMAAGSGYVDIEENTKDLVVAIAGAEAQVFLTLRKISGYATKVETATFGAYDDETRVGASTTLSGSPDKV